jgi:hypothetical protein
MDWQTAINFGGSALIAAIGWFARQLWTAVDNLKKDVTDLGLHVSENYVKKAELQTFKSDMDKRFDRIEMLIDKVYLKVDAKADK